MTFWVTTLLTIRLPRPQRKEDGQETPIHWLSVHSGRHFANFISRPYSFHLLFNAKHPLVARGLCFMTSFPKKTTIFLGNLVSIGVIESSSRPFCCRFRLYMSLQTMPLFFLSLLRLSGDFLEHECVTCNHQRWDQKPQNHIWTSV